MSRRPIKPPAKGRSLANEARDFDEFLKRELPPAMLEHASYIADAVQRAGERYDRFVERDEWRDFTARSKRLKNISASMEDLASGLCDLDILSLADLECRVDPKEIATLVGSLRLFKKQIDILVQGIQKKGRPRDLAEERWIIELADIFENTFPRRPTISGSGYTPIDKRGMFYKFLELNRPGSYPQRNKLHPSQIVRVLKRREAGKSCTASGHTQRG
jgi:hypothetical protein